MGVSYTFLSPDDQLQCASQIFPKKRITDSPDRVFGRERQWYFRTREGDRGRFPTRAAANLVREHFVDTMEYLDENKHALPSDVDWGDVTMVDIGKPNRFTR